MNNQQGGQGQSSSLFSLNFIMTATFKRKKLLIAFFVAVVGITTVVNYYSPHIYESNAKLILEQEQDVEEALLLNYEERLNIANLNWLNSELAIINSYPVAERVVSSLQLYKTVDEETDSVLWDLRSAINQYQASMSVQRSDESNVIAISFTDQDPHVTTQVVNKIIETYVSYRSELYSEAESFRFIEDQMEIADQQLREKEQVLANYKTEKGIISPEAQQSILSSRLQEYERSRTSAAATRISLEKRLEQIKSQFDTNPNDISIPTMPNTVAQAQYVGRLKEELVTLEISKDQMLQEYTEQYQGVVSLEQQIASTRDKIREAVQEIIVVEDAALAAVRAEEQEFKRLVAQTKAEIRELAQTTFEVEQRSRGVQDSRDIYSALLKQREEARISLAKLQSGVRIKIVSPAITPLEPVAPNKRANVAAAIFLGLLGGIGLAIAIEFFDTSIESADELEELGGLTVLGSVREMDEEGASGPRKMRQTGAS